MFDFSYFVIVLFIWIKLSSVQATLSNATHLDGQFHNFELSADIQQDFVSQLSSSQRLHLTHEFLNFLGLSSFRPPRPKPRQRKNAASQYFLNNEDAKLLLSTTASEVILAFPVKEILKLHKSNQLLFDLSDFNFLHGGKDIKDAQLKFYKKRSQRSGNITLIYDLKNTTKYLDNTLSGWLNANLTSHVKSYFSKNILGRYFAITVIAWNMTSSLTEDIYICQEFGVLNQQSYNLQPFLLITLNERNQKWHQPPSHPQIQQRIKRLASRSNVAQKVERKKRKRSSNNGKASTSCSRRKLVVNFSKIGWHEWILAPDGYDAYFCSGQCTFPLRPSWNITNHAIIQTLMNLQNGQLYPQSQCVPVSLSSLYFLHYAQNGESLIWRKYRDMKVDACGCH